MPRSIRLLPLGLLVLALSALSAPVGAYRAPRRTVAQVAFAIATVRPGLAAPVRRAWASTLVSVAEAHNFDPLTGWAIIAHESRWRPGAEGDGLDIGLAQIRYTTSRHCRASRQAPACQAWRRQLHDPATNMRQMAHAITEWRKTCTAITGKALLKHVLQGYGGFSQWPKRAILCGRQKHKGRWRDLPVPAAVQAILDLRHAMIRRLQRERR